MRETNNIKERDLEIDVWDQAFPSRDIFLHFSATNALFMRADQALYRSKKQGKNQVVFEISSGEDVSDMDGEAD